VSYESETLPTARCPVHGKPGVMIYPCCVGAKGGAVSTAKKRAAAVANLEKARQAKPRPP